MADTTGLATSSLIEELLSHGHEFTFHQVMRIARRHMAAGGAGDLPEITWQERVRVRPELSLAFPAADVCRVERAGDDGMGLLVTATFLGLYGTSSPLPTHYSEDLLDEAAADLTLTRDFLDMLHQRLYQLYFQCWSKYRLFLRVAEERDPEELERLFCLIGLGGKELRQSVPDAESLLRYIGLFSQPRSALGLRTLLRDALGVERLEIEQFVSRQVPIPKEQQTRLGMASSRLGVDTVLGNQMPDRMGKFRIHLGPLSRKEFDSFLPGTPRHERVARLTKLYIVDPFDFDLRLILAAGEAEPIRLGDPDAPRLGLNSWCFSGATLGDVSAIFPVVEEPGTAVIPEHDSVTSEEAGRPHTLTDYYQHELARLRDLATAYAHSHPEMAFLVSGHLADPSVERLFEGVAFMNANLQQKLDDDLPEIINDIMYEIEPNYMRPLPATTIICFTPKSNCMRSELIPVKTELKSVPSVDGMVCRFTTCYPVEIHPLTLTDAFLSQPAGKPATITLHLKLTCGGLNEWNIKSLRFFLAGENKQAANLYLALMNYLKRIVIAPAQTGQRVALEPSCLNELGFQDTEGLLPSVHRGAGSQQRMLEYFIQPAKFLFVELQGFDRWCGRGAGNEFEIHFELLRLPFELHHIGKVDFALFATPAVNLFKIISEPIAVDNKKTEYQVGIIDEDLEHRDIYSVDHVIGHFTNSCTKIFLPSNHELNRQPCKVPSYGVHWRTPATSDRFDAFLFVETSQLLQDISTIQVEMTCTNGNFTTKLKIGDICKETDSSPNFARFTNIRPVTESWCFGLENDRLWKLYSFSNRNISLLDAMSLQEMLKVILKSSCMNLELEQWYIALITGIYDVKLIPAVKVVQGSIASGWDIKIVLNVTDGAPGIVYLFGAQLNHLINGFATKSSFTRIRIENVACGEKYEWPAKMGRRS